MKMKPGTKKPPMGMGSVKPQMQGPISGGAGGGRAAPSWMPPPPGSPGAPQLNLQPFVGGPSQGRPAMPSRGSMPLPPSAAPRPAPGGWAGKAMPQMPFGGAIQRPQPPAGGAPMAPPPMMGGGDPIDRFGGGFNPQQMQVQRAAGVFDKPQMGPAGDPRADMMAQMQAAQSRMGQFQRPAGQMGSIGPPPGPGGGMGPGGFDMTQANQMRDAWRQQNPNPVMNQAPAGRPMPDLGGAQDRMRQLMAARGGGF
jgi:hypothetical protein